MDAVGRRDDLLELLAEAPHHKRDVIDALDISRSTVDRALDELVEADLVARTDDGFETTLAGRLALERYRSYVEASSGILSAADVLAALPPDADLDAALLAGAEVHRASGTAPYRPLEALHETVASADRYRALLPALEDPRHVRLLYEHVVVDDGRAELVVGEELAATLREEFPRRLDAMRRSDGFDLLVGEVPPYALVVTDEEEESTATVVAFGDADAPTAVVQNRATEAVGWATDAFERHREAAEEPFGRFAANGGASTTGAGAPPEEGELPRSLAAAGFVRLSTSYFANEPVADPTTAWRSGMALPEVYSGYAAERTREVDGEHVPLTDDLLDRLEGGAVCALVGPPGSGKSTVCRAVATAWYIDGRGPVFYRRSGRGGAFEDPEPLVDAVASADGDALVVVEDAVRPEARGSLRALRELAAREDVAVLLDARELEWQDPPGPRLAPDVDAARAELVDVVPMPPLHERDARALVEHVERTVGRRVEVPVDALLEGLTEDSARGVAPGDVLLFVHRLAATVDPSAEEPTPMEETVSDVVAALRSLGDAALDVGVTVNLLNAAGLPVAREVLEAVEVADAGTLEDALDRLEGAVLFEASDADDGAYRPVHEAWSTAFLAHLLETEGEAAARERFGRCAGAVLALGASGGPSPLPGVTVDGGVARADDAPSAGARGVDRLVESVFALGLRYPKLAPLFGTAADATFELPPTADDDTELRCLAWRGRMYARRGDVDPAAAEFRRLHERTPDPCVDGADAEPGRLHVEALLGLADVAHQRGDHETVREQARAARAAAEALEAPQLAVQADAREGRALRETGEYGEAATVLERGLETARDLGARDGELECLLALGLTETYRRELDDAIAYKERAYELARELGDREREQRAADDLGMDHVYRDDLAAADEWEGRALELARELGNRRAEAVILGNFASRDLMRGHHEAAAERLETALSISRQVDETASEPQLELKLGVAYCNLGDPAAAVEHTEAGLEQFRNRDMPRDRIFGNITLARAAVERGDLDDAETHVGDAVDLSESLEGDPFRASCERVLGRIHRERGDLDAARSHLEESVALAEDVGSDYKAGWAQRELAAVAAERGDHREARELLASAVDRLESAGGYRLAVGAVEHLVRQCEALDEREAAREWCERGLELCRQHGFEDEVDAFDEARRRLTEGG